MPLRFDHSCTFRRSTKRIFRAKVSLRPTPAPLTVSFRSLIQGRDYPGDRGGPETVEER